MTRDSASRDRTAIALLLLASTTNVPAAMAALKRVAIKEEIELSDDEVRRAVTHVRSTATAILAGLPISDTPTNGVYARLGLGVTK